MPGTRKAYWVKAFLFQNASDESHWQEWNFDVEGLSTLPDTLAWHVIAFLKSLAPGAVDSWKSKQLPKLRNSLSYHGGEQGVTSFPVTTAEGVTYKLRAFVGCVRPAPTFTLTATLHYYDDPAETLETWVCERRPDLHATIGELRAIVGQYLGQLPMWNISHMLARLRTTLRKVRKPVPVIANGGGTAYIVRITVERHA